MFLHRRPSLLARYVILSIVAWVTDALLSLDDMISWPVRALCLTLAVVRISQPLSAQQVDVHGSYIAGDGDLHDHLTGVGVGARWIYDLRRVYVGAKLGADYSREAHLGPGRGAFGFDLTIAPRREIPVLTPYAGAGLSANWSGGQQREWSGVRGGLEGIVGADVSLLGLQHVGLKLEERYGAISGLKRTFTTRAGFIVGF